MKTNGGSDETLLVQFERDISNVPLLGLVEGVTGISRSTIMFGVGFIAFICVLLGLLDNLLTNLIGFAYPAYASFKAIESTDLNGNTQWLTYWVVFASFTMVEYFSCTLLYYFPLYYPTKMLFLLWCFLPQTQGAAWVYRTIVRPFLMTHESKIDASLQKAIDHIKEVVQGEAVQEIARRVQELLKKAQEKKLPPSSPELASMHKHDD